MTGKGRNSLSYSDRTRIVVFSMIAGLVFALCLFFGRIYAENRLLADVVRADYLYGFKSFFICSAASLFLFTLTEGITAPKESNIPWYLRTEDNGASETESSKPAASRKTIIKVSGIYFILSWIVYIPVFLAVYPGIYGYDASSQLMQLYHTFGLPLTTHHPLIHTFYLGACMELGGRLFHSYQAGMAIYSMSQVMAVVCIFDFVITRLYIKGANKAFLALGSAFLILNPYIVVSSFLTTKDILFGAFFMVFLMEVFLTVKGDEFFCSDKKLNIDVIVLIFSGTLMCLFRNQGIYVLIFFMIFAIPVLKNRKFAAAMAGILILWGILSVGVPKVMGISGGDPREMLSVPMQQMARVYNNYPEALDGDEKKYIESIISEQGLKNYVRVNADPVKAEFNSEAALSDKGEFISQWAGIGLKKPDVYADSFLMMCYGYWYPLKTQYWISVISYDGDYMEQPYNIFDIRRMSRLPQLDIRLRELVREPYFDNVPFLGFLLNQAFPFWLTIFSGVYFAYKRKYRMIIPLLLPFGYWGTLLLGPVTVFRYTLALVYSVPVIIAFLTYKN